MEKPRLSTREFIDGLNRHIGKTAKENPAQNTLTCTECGKEYVAKDMADYFVCPHCGKTQQDEEDFEEN